MDEILVAIQDAANTIATPNWADILSTIFSFAAIVVAGVIAWRQNKIAEEQTAIAAKQNEFSAEQTQIAAKQMEFTKEQTQIAENQDKLVERQIRISEQQNRIALFEKQYAVYRELAKIISIGEELDSQQMPTRNQLLDALETSWGIILTHEQDTHAKSVAIVKKVIEAEQIIAQSIFLFPNVNEKDIDDLLYSAAEFMGSVFFGENTDFKDVSVKNFINASKDFKEKYYDMIVEELNLTGGV